MSTAEGKNVVVTRGRVALLVAALVLVGIGWTAWLMVQAYGGLRDAEQAVGRLERSLRVDDRGDQQAAIDELADGAAQARDATDGWWWGALTHLPALGDDFESIEVIGASLDTAADGLPPLLEVAQELDGVTSGGRVDLDTVRRLEEPVAVAADAFGSASDEAAVVEADDLVETLATQFVNYRDDLTQTADGLAAGRTAIELLPEMAGADDERDYLLIFQNNAEVRATGGLPGSWARLHADQGRLTLREQGSWPDFDVADEPVVELTPGEETVFGDGIATYFSNPGYSRDFPRAARIWDAFWQRKYPQTDLDGVIALDPVALSYLVEGTGPVRVDDQVLTADRLVQQVLNDPYLRLPDQQQQDAFFQDAARSIFEAVTGDLRSPFDFVSGLARAGREGRLLVAPFNEDEAASLAGTTVEGSLTAPDPAVPRVDIGFNDQTGSKMSYYLRYDGQVDAVGCADGRQELAGSLSVSQDLDPAEATRLPVTVTGDGRYGTEPGSQLVNVQIYGPAGGEFGPIQVDGEEVQGLTVAAVDGRPVAQLAILLDSRDDIVVTWSMRTGEGQTGGPVLTMTPSVVPGTEGGRTASAC